jgi:hypothetical protein
VGLSSLLLSFRDVEDLLAERGIIVSYETIRQWCEKFGLDYSEDVLAPFCRNNRFLFDSSILSSSEHASELTFAKAGRSEMVAGQLCSTSLLMAA